ncbi:MAG: hypothetical protein ABII22_05545 [Candidatus Micrarchaeota archaeon]
MDDKKAWGECKKYMDSLVAIYSDAKNTSEKRSEALSGLMRFAYGVRDYASVTTDEVYKNPDPKIRLEYVRINSYWSDYRIKPTMQWLAANDKDEEVRKAAAAIVYRIENQIRDNTEVNSMYKRR